MACPDNNFGPNNLEKAKITDYGNSGACNDEQKLQTRRTVHHGNKLMETSTNVAISLALLKEGELRSVDGFDTINKLGLLEIWTHFH